MIPELCIYYQLAYLLIYHQANIYSYRRIDRFFSRTICPQPDISGDFLGKVKLH